MKKCPVCNTRLFVPRKRILPVIRVMGQKQAETDASIAIEAGVDGVFLVATDDCGKENDDLLMRVFRKIKSARSGSWIGVKFPNQRLENVFPLASRLEGLNAVWADDILVVPGQREIMEEYRLAMIWKQFLAGNKDFEFFCSIGYKGQPNYWRMRIGDLEKQARATREYVDVLTTSGPSSGSPPPLNRLRAVTRGAARKQSNTQVAVASGVSAANVGDFLPFVDCILLRTSILTADRSTFDKQKIVECIEKVRAWEGTS